MIGRGSRGGVSLRRRHVLVFSGWSMALALAACSKSEPQPQESEIPWVPRTEPDITTIAVPQGWVLLDLDEKPVAVQVKITTSHTDYSHAGIHILHSIDSIDPPRPRKTSADLEADRDRAMSDSTQTGWVSDPQPLAPRTIAGSETWGYVGMFTFNSEKTYPSQYWRLWREDGLRHIYVAGFEGTDTIPPELIAALDTIAFFPAGSLPSASPS